MTDLIEKKFNYKIFNLIAMAILFIISFVLYIINNGHESIWYDEALGLYFIQYNYIDLIKGVALSGAEAHPPFYHILLKTVSLLFGKSIVVLRGVSAVFGSLIIILMFHFSKKMFNFFTAITVSLILMFNPIILSYSQEIRMYTLITVFSIVNLFSFYFAVEKSKYDYNNKLQKNINGYWIVYLASSITGLYTHYFFMYSFFITFTYMIYQLFILKKETLKFKNIFILYFISNLISIIFFVPWIPFLLLHMRYVKEAPWFASFNLSSLVRIIGFFFTTKFGYDVNNHIPYYILIFLFFTVLILAIIISLKNKKKLSGTIVFLLLAYIVPVIVSAIFSIFFFSNILLRYYILFIPFLFLLLAVCINQFRYKITSTVIILFIITAGIITNITIYKENINGETRELAAYLDKNIKKNEPIVCFDLKIMVLLYQLTDYDNIYFYSDYEVLNSMGNRFFYGDKQMIRRNKFIYFLHNNKSFWAVFEPYPGDVINNYFDSIAYNKYKLDKKVSGKEFTNDYTWIGYKVYRFVKEKK